MHLAHANGFPPATYRCLAAPLSEHCRLVSVAYRPLWDRRPPATLTSWHELACDLGRALRGRGIDGVIGVGHSLGAVTTLLAAAHDPGLFAAVVLIDPVMLSGSSSLLWRVMTTLGLRRLLPIVRGARRRRDQWPSREAVRGSWTAARVFAGWDRAVLDDYIECGVVECSEGVRLAYPRAWEARVFETAPANVWPALRQVDVPILLIQGERTDTFLRSAARRARRILGEDRVAIVAGASHFLPMERPGEVARLIAEFIETVPEDLTPP